jgi:hypothetical protein
VLSAGSNGIAIKNNGLTSLYGFDPSGNFFATGLVQGEFLRFGTGGATSTLVSSAGGGNINIGLPNVATTLAGLGLAQTFTATQTFSVAFWLFQDDPDANRDASHRGG